MNELKAFRLKRKLSRKDLSIKSGVHEKTIQLIEEEKTTDIKLNTLIALSKALNTKVRNIVNKDIAKHL